MTIYFLWNAWSSVGLCILVASVGAGVLLHSITPR